MSKKDFFPPRPSTKPTILTNQLSDSIAQIAMQGEFSP